MTVFTVVICSAGVMVTLADAAEDHTLSGSFFPYDAFERLPSTRIEVDGRALSWRSARATWGCRAPPCSHG
jgi:hypothetical protein